MPGAGGRSAASRSSTDKAAAFARSTAARTCHPRRDVERLRGGGDHRLDEQRHERRRLGRRGGGRRRGRHDEAEALERLTDGRRQNARDVRVPGMHGDHELRDLARIGRAPAGIPALHRALGRVHELPELLLVEEKRELRLDDGSHEVRVHHEKGLPAILLVLAAIRELLGGVERLLPANGDTLGGHGLAFPANRDALGGMRHEEAAFRAQHGGEDDDDTATRVEEGGLLVQLPAKLLELPAKGVALGRTPVEEPALLVRHAVEDVGTAAIRVVRSCEKLGDAAIFVDL